MPIGVPLGKDTDPNVRRNIQQLNDFANGKAGSGTFGNSYRWTEGPFPTDSSSICALLQFKKGTNWVTVEAIKADGTNALSCAASYATATTQTVNIATSTVINYNTKEFDTDNAVTTGANWLFKTPVGKGGLYQMEMNISLVINPVVVGSFTMFPSGFKNGGEIKRGLRYNITPNAAGNDGLFYMNLVSMVLMSPGDTWYFAVFQNSGQTATFEVDTKNNYCSITRMNYY